MSHDGEHRPPPEQPGADQGPRASADEARQAAGSGPGAHGGGSRGADGAGHGDHGGPRRGHEKHAGHDPEAFRRKFWFSLALTIPIILTSRLVMRWLNYSLDFPGVVLIGPVLGSIVFFYGGWPFIDVRRARCWFWGLTLTAIAAMGGLYRELHATPTPPPGCSPCSRHWYWPPRPLRPLGSWSN